MADIESSKNSDVSPQNHSDQAAPQQGGRWIVFQASLAAVILFGVFLIVLAGGQHALLRFNALFLAIYFLLVILYILTTRVVDGSRLSRLGAFAFGVACIMVALYFCAPPLLHDAARLLTLLNGSNPQVVVYLIELRNGFAAYYWLPILLGFGLALTYIVTDKDESTFYREVILPRRAVWITFSAAVFITLWLTTSLGIDVNQQAVAAQPVLFHTAQTARHLESDFETLAFDLQPLTTAQTITTTTDMTTVLGDVDDLISDTLVLSDVVSVGLPVNTLTSTTQSLSVTSNATATMTTTAAALDTASYSKSASYTALLNLATKSALALERQLADELHAVQPLTPQEIVRKLVAEDGRPIAHVESLVGTITMTLDRLTDMNSVSYFTVALLYSLFLLLPWLFFVVFIVTRRRKVIAETERDLRDLDLFEGFMHPDPSVQGPDDYLARCWVQDLAHVVQDNQEQARKGEGRSATNQDNNGVQARNARLNELTSDTGRRIFTHNTFEQLKEVSTNKDEYSKLILRLRQQIEREAVRFVIGRSQFYGDQYLIPLILLTVVSAVGWYYVFLAGTVTDLYGFVQQGGSASMLNALLTNNLTPFTVAFLGGWIFVIILLFNCWTQDDLHPRNYFYAAAHLMIAMIVGFVAANALKQSENFLVGLSVTGAALVISLLPYDSIDLLARRGLGAIGQRFGGDGKESSSPLWVSHELQSLGMTIWDETRLHQEGIDTLVDLAGCDLLNLVLQTDYEAAPLADWVDTALLRVHTNTVLAGYLAAANIRTATGLVLACSDGDYAQGSGDDTAANLKIGNKALSGVSDVAKTVIQMARMVEAQSTKTDAEQQEKEKQPDSDATLQNVAPDALIGALAASLKFTVTSLLAEHNLQYILYYRLQTLRVVGERRRCAAQQALMTVRPPLPAPFRIKRRRAMLRRAGRTGQSSR